MKSHSFRKPLSIVLSLCILFSMISVSEANEPDSTDPYYQSFSAGETENITLGDLVLPADFEDMPEYGQFGAVVLSFPDGEGGGDVSVQTGTLTSMGEEYQTEITTEYFSYTDYRDGYGAVVLMDDASKLDLDTGAISSEGSGVYIEMHESSELDLAVDGDINAERTGIRIENENKTSVTITTNDIIANDCGVDVSNEENSYAKITVDSIQASNGPGISVNNEKNSDMEMKVNGDINGGRGIWINNHDDSDAKIESGSINSNSTGVMAELYDGSDAEIKVNGGIYTKSGYGIMSQTDGGSTVAVDVTGSVTTEDGMGLDLNLSAFDPDELRQEADVTIGGVLQSSDQAIYIHNNVNGHVTINIGTDETIENSGTITSTGADAIFLNTIAKSSIELNGGDVYGAGNSNNIRANAEGNDSSINISVGNVTGSGSADGVSATAGHESSQVKIDTGNIKAGGIGVSVNTDSRFDYGNVEYGNCYGSGGIMTVNAGKVNGGYGGISASADGGTLNVKSGAVQSGEKGFGVSVSTSGAYAEQGVTVTVDGTVTAGETGINVGSINETERELCYENDKSILVDPDDPHENWWERMRIDETGRYVLVPVDRENGIEWKTYLWYDTNHPQYNEYSEEDINNFEVFDDFFDWVDWEYAKVTTKTENYARVSTGAVTAGQYGVTANNHGGDFDIRVGGGVTVAGAESYMDDWSGYIYYNEAQGVTATSTAGTTSIMIDGDLSVFSVASEAASGVNPDGGEGAGTGAVYADPDGRYTGNGVTIGNYEGKIDIAINGDVNAEEGTAVSVIPKYSWEQDLNNGEAILSIAGDVNAENGVNVGINGNGTGHVAINIGGDLNTTGTGLMIGNGDLQTDDPLEETNEENAEEDGNRRSISGEALRGGSETEENNAPAVDIVVQETISGLVPILVSNMQAVSNVMITTWAVKPNENNQITENASGETVREVEKSINYIIKKEDNEYGTLSVEGTTVKTLSDDTELNVAHEGKKLTLTVDLAEQYKTGYEVVIYNGKGENTQEATVEKQENGDFSFMVPWAGGVYLTFGVKALNNTEPAPDPDPEPDPDPQPDPDPEPEPDPEPDPDPQPDPDPDPQPEPRPEPEKMSENTGAGLAGRVIAIIYGEDEEYTIWFLSGYCYHAVFKDGTEEKGTYSVNGNVLVLSNKNGEECKLDNEWRMDFGKERKAEYIKADFSDSEKIIGEFNTNENGILEIQDETGNAISLNEIEKTINNRYALEILNAILPYTGEQAQI